MPKKPIRFRIFENPDSASAQVAAEMAQLIRERATLGRTAVIGFATGKTSLPLFEELIYLYREEGLSFRNVVSFNLDEYIGLKGDHPRSFRYFMERNLFDHIDIPPENIHFLNGRISQVNTACIVSPMKRKSPMPAGSTCRFSESAATAISVSTSRTRR